MTQGMVEWCKCVAVGAIAMAAILAPWMVMLVKWT